MLAALVALGDAPLAELRETLRGLWFALDEREQSQLAVRHPCLGEGRPHGVAGAVRDRRGQVTEGALAVRAVLGGVVCVVRSHM